MIKRKIYSLHTLDTHVVEREFDSRNKDRETVQERGFGKTVVHWALSMKLECVLIGFLTFWSQRRRNAKALHPRLSKSWGDNNLRNVVTFQQAHVEATSYWHRSNVVSTSLQRHAISSLIRGYINIMCPLAPFRQKEETLQVLKTHCHHTKKDSQWRRVFLLFYHFSWPTRRVSCPCSSQKSNGKGLIIFEGTFTLKNVKFHCPG